MRVSCNPSTVQRIVTPREAIALLRRLRRLETHSFWILESLMVELPDEILARIQGYRQITDAVLLAAAMRRGGELATFDTGLANLVTETGRGSVCVIPV